MADPFTLAAAATGGSLAGSTVGQVIGKGRRRREKKNIRKQLERGFLDINRLLGGPVTQQFGGFTTGATAGPTAGQVLGLGLGVGAQGLGALSQALGFLQPGTELPFGLNAPGVQEQQIAAAQDDVNLATQRGVRQAANLIPELGGAGAGLAARAIREGATGAGQIGAAIRARAAEQDLANRLDLVRTTAGALPALGSGLGGLVGAGIAPFQLQGSVLDRILQLRSNIAGTRAGFLGQEIAQANQQQGLLGQGGSLLAMLPFLV